MEATIERLIIMGLFVIIIFHQRHRIKGLTDSLKDTKTVLDIIKPELLKYRTEFYEQIIRKEKEFDIKKIEDAFIRELEDKEKNINKFIK